MGDRFDSLAKDAAAELPRREVFRRLGGGLLAILLASVGLAGDNDNDTCGRLCAVCCNNIDFPPRGAEHGQCIRDCRAGVNLCGQLVRAEGVTCEPGRE
jgi:hypothetical protein